jgi:hypothetical protein
MTTRGLTRRKNNNPCIVYAYYFALPSVCAVILTLIQPRHVSSELLNSIACSNFYTGCVAVAIAGIFERFTYI